MSRSCQTVKTSSRRLSIASPSLPPMPASPGSIQGATASVADSSITMGMGLRSSRPGRADNSAGVSVSSASTSSSATVDSSRANRSSIPATCLSICANCRSSPIGAISGEPVGCGPMRLWRNGSSQPLEAGPTKKNPGWVGRDPIEASRISWSRSLSLAGGFPQACPATLSAWPTASRGSGTDSPYHQALAHPHAQIKEITRCLCSFRVMVVDLDCYVVVAGSTMLIQDRTPDRALIFNKRCTITLNLVKGKRT